MRRTPYAKEQYAPDFLRTVFKQYVNKWVGLWVVPGNGDCLFLLEQLLSRNSILWTIRVQGSSKSVNWANWYNCLQGLHQVITLLIECKSLSSVEVHLCESSKALNILEDPSLPMSLHAIEESFKEGKTFRDLMRKFSAMKGGSFHYLGAQSLIKSYEDQVGSFEDFSAWVGKAWSTIKLVTWTKDASKGNGKGKKRAASMLDDVLGQHDVLSIMHPWFWKQAHPHWFTGWRDSDAKRMAMLGAGIGWALLDRWLVDTKMLELFLDGRARWTMWIADHALGMCGKEPWWHGIFESRKLPARPGVQPDFMKEYLRSKACKETLAEKKRKGEEDAPGVVPPKKRRNKKDPAPILPTPNASSLNSASNAAVLKTCSSLKNKKSPEQYQSDSDEDPPVACGGDDPTPHGDEPAPVTLGDVAAKVVERQRDRAPQSAEIASSGHALIAPGIEEFDFSFAAWTKLPDHGCGVQPPPKDFHNHHQTNLRPVLHVFAPSIVSSHMPHNSSCQLYMA
ncbi:hypothetical protein FRC06_000723 [Ceratobasidium sp. 370]|nr:hypothetical protein FRC06_000723 [Ceratobasidium sp. 370]